ncbi:MAG TPA: response regulator transcription factor [Actinomycetota bacterium]|nr:response regulator transcription factor [Actinomycetota bacterium]
MPPDPISVLLMDDHVVVREGLRALLERHEDIAVVAEASTVGEAEAVEVDPVVIVADLVLPDERGADVVRRLKERHPDSAVLVLTMVDNPTDVQLCLAAGASGYLLKESASTELVDAVRKVAAGTDYLQPALGAALARWRETPARVHGRVGGELTPRERDVLRLIALGHTNAEIAAMLYVSVRTVENHRSSLMRKLGLRTRADLVRHANELGLV